MDGVSDHVGILGDRLLKFEVALAERDEQGVPGGLASLIDEEFEEFGASGRRWDRAAILEHLATTPAGIARIEGFAIVALSADVVLTTYETVASTKGYAGRRALRSSIWIKRRSGWKLRFHQGTPVP
jgi:hypothetical protein